MIDYYSKGAITNFVESNIKF